MQIPGDGITALHRAGLIPDPYWGRNEYDLRWIADRDWTITRTVMLDDPDVDLILSGLDTVATVACNGVAVLATQNSFRSYRVALADVAKQGENTLAITFRSSTAAANALQAAQPFPIPFQAANSPIPNGNMLRKVQCDFGWDWNIALAPFGLYCAPRLEPSGGERIDRVIVDQTHADGAVTLKITADLTHATGADYAITFAGQTIDGTVQDAQITAIFDIDNPALWWPAGLGPQVLHDLTVTVGDATAHRRIGLRSVELVTEPDAAGSSFTFRVNGHDTFMRGANWIPADALAGRIDDAKTRNLLQSAVDANMNMLRVWGGGRYEPDSFYDACDELGLMVWQDFMFSCNLYPSTPDFLSEVRAEVAENVARLQHHACIALWCGDNELVGALTWFEESRNDRDRYLVNYDRLNRTIEETLRATDPAALWWPSSPCPGPMNFGDSWHDDGAGDMHFWSVWHEGRDFDHYRDVSPRFCSEFGFQSYPSMATIRTFADEKDWNIASPVFESHQKNAGGNARIAETMFRYFRWPERFEDFVWLSQIQQGLAIKTAVTHWRGLKPRCMGALYWQLNDTWPVCSWSSLDHGGNWKLLHHMAQKFFAPVTVVCTPDGDALVLRGVNDGLHPADLTVTARAVNMHSAIRDLGQATATVGTAATDMLRLPKSALADDEILIFVWDDPQGHQGGDHFAPRPYKSYDLPDPALSLDTDGTTLTISSDAVGLFVTAEADVPGRFSNNAFTVFPGHPARITFTPDTPGAQARFTLRDLHTATTAR
jgi:beta-mannosidase